MLKNVVVAGVPRSGTSMTAGVYARQGYYVTPDETRDLVQEDATNPMGYWESQTLIERNVEVLRAVDFPFHNTWGFDPIAPEQVARIAELEPLPGHRRFVEEYAEHAPWLWKDPRLCLTLSYWWKVLPAADTAVVVVRRDSDEVYRSFRRVQFTKPERESREDIDAMIEQHMATLWAAIEHHGIPYAVVDHRDFFEDPGSAARTLGDAAGLKLESEDLHVRTELNHSTPAGRVRTAVGWLYMQLPVPARRLVKSVTPRAVAKRVSPEKKYIS